MYPEKTLCDNNQVYSNSKPNHALSLSHTHTHTHKYISGIFAILQLANNSKHAISSSDKTSVLSENVQ